MSRVKKGREFRGNILAIRSVEDCIRATKKYTEGVQIRKTKHPVQGEDFPSRVFFMSYDVYPNLDIRKIWDMPAGRGIDWLLGKYEGINAMFHYDYRVNKASVLVRDGDGAVKKLTESIPGFGDALKAINEPREKSKV